MRFRPCAAVLLSLFLAPVAPAQLGANGYTIVAIAGSNELGARPRVGLVRGPDGNYYGTASEGGAFGGGTVFRLTPDGTLSTVFSFPYDEGNPGAELTVSSDGNLYGTTAGPAFNAPHSKGTIFRLTLAGERTVRATFTNGSQPVSPQPLVEASDGNFYGATANGGAQGLGELFRISKDGVLTTLVTFTGPNGATPLGGMIEGIDGNLYGTTSGGGTPGAGTVYRLTKSGVLSTVASFEFGGDIGRNPTTALMQDSAGNLYGVTSVGFANSPGSVFRVTLDGVFTLLGRMPSSSARPSSPLVFGDDGELYGTTPDHYYRVSPTGAGLSVLLNFNAAFEGRRAGGALLKVGNGEFLATTQAGGTTNRNIFGIVQRLTQQGTATPVVAFPAPVGRNFNSELSEGRDGQLYGTALDDRSGGGFFSSRLGGFKLSLSGGAVPLRRLPTSSSLDTGGTSSRVVRAPDGNLYGAVSQGGQNTGDFPLNQGPTGFIYRINANDSVSMAFQFVGFGDGSPNETGDEPRGGLVVGPDSQLYGTAALGGAGGRGTLFKLDLAGNLTVLHSFTLGSPVGVIPRGELIFTDGVFYGTTGSGGANDRGTFFSASPDGQVTALYNFPTDRNVSSDSRLILARDGNFYGVFYNGGPNDRGSVFRLTKSGELTTFAEMNAETGSGPIGIMQASDGNFYGVTRRAEEGALFRINQEGAITVLAKFSNETGTGPASAPVEASDGNLYGATIGGGPSRGGVVYRVQILPPKQLLNISTRLRVEAGENVLIGGFIVGGTQPKKVIVRAMGPSLQQGGVSGVLANPTLELRRSDGSLIAANDNWKASPQRAEIEASGVPPSADAESAIVATLAPGDYTAIVSGVNSSTGVGLVEVYDLDQTADSRLANISTRGLVATGENVMIAGLIAGQGSSSAKGIVRSLGPSLQQSGVAGVLADPTLELRDANGELIIGNDNWKDDPAQAAEIQASGIPPQHDLEAAVALTLPTGLSTAIVRGKGETTGVGLVEVYNIR